MTSSIDRARSPSSPERRLVCGEGASSGMPVSISRPGATRPVELAADVRPCRCRMSEALEAIVKLLALAAAIAIVSWLAREKAAPARHRGVPIGLAVLGGLGYVNFGRFHTDGSPLHVWDQFHYVLGSKYYPELGYDGLY